MHTPQKITAVVIALFIGLCAFYWLYLGVFFSTLHLDYARDLTALSELWLHRIVWLGPQLRSGFPTSPFYFYVQLPILWATHGSAYALILTQVLTATAALGLYAYLNKQTLSWRTLLFLASVACTPWWVVSASSAWNGYIYVPVVFATLTVLWMEKNLGIAALLLSSAVALHPAAAVIAPLWIYEYIRRKGSLLTIGAAALLATLPWLPLLAFEIITRGYLFRQWQSLTHTDGLQAHLNPWALADAVQNSGIPVVALVILVVLTFIQGTGRMRWWMGLALLPLLFFSATTQIQDYYYYGMFVACSFVWGVTLVRTWLGTLLLGAFVCMTTVGLLTYPPGAPVRPIERIQNTANALIDMHPFTPTDTIALISVIDYKNSGPQADDYRFFLRTAGYSAVSIPEYPTANYLALIVEDPNFAWKDWRDWHTDYFGARKLLKVQKVGDTTIILYTRP